MPAVFNMSDPAARVAGIRAAIEALAAGALVAMPTETVYGLAANAADPAAVARVFAAKGRPRFNPLIVHVSSAEAARRLAELGTVGEKLAADLWPGALTLVARRRPGSPIAELAGAGLPTTALRVPSHPVAAELIAACGLALAAPSANRSGHVSATTAAHVVDDLGDAVAVVLDAGAAPLGVESTIVAVDRDPPALLRAGAVPRAVIEAVLGRSLADAPAGSGSPQAPGMLASHYAPGVPLRTGATSVRPGESLLAFGPRLPPGGGDARAVVNLSPAGDLVEAASKLFGALRELERVGAPIAAMPIPGEGLGEAINDRLARGAAPRR